VKVARLLIDDVASPVLALVVDGAYYDVAKLEELWRWARGEAFVDFHTRVVAARCSGLDRIEARLAAGDRPSAARILPGEFLPLPPCDVDRAAYWQGDLYRPGEHPAFRPQNSRDLVGDGQPAAFPPSSGSPVLEPGLALVLAEDLWRADPIEAARAILGYTLVLDWHVGDDANAVPPSHLGPFLVTRPNVSLIAERQVSLAGDAVERRASKLGSWRFHPAEALSYLSHFVGLRAGDVIGLGTPFGAPSEIGFGAHVRFALEPDVTLHGWAVEGLPLGRWRSA
jgi:hypothetical protein